MSFPHCPLFFLRRAFCVAAFVALFFLLPLSFRATETDAVPEIAASVPYTVAELSSGAFSALSDGKRATEATLSGTLTLSFSAPVKHLYFIWELEPGDWTLSADGRTYVCGGSRFLHECVTLASPARTLTLNFPRDVRVCDLELFSSGDLPSRVQVWTPSASDCDLLLFPTHADDELLFFGGTMAHYTAEGKVVQVAYLTNHRGEPYRLHELLDGLWTCGVKCYPLWSESKDVYCGNLTAAQKYYGEQFLNFQVEQIRRFRPEVIVGHDLNGEYGHGAHQLNARSLREAIELAADSSYLPQTEAWQVKKLYLHLYAENALVMDWSVPLAAFGGKTALEVATEAFARHVSQTPYFSVNASGPYDCRLFGLAYSTVGSDEVKNDFFEHIPPRLPEPEPIVPEPPVPEAPTVESESPSEEPPVSHSALLPEFAPVLLCAVLLLLVLFRIWAGKKGNTP